jgi:hypothetical protein
MGREKVKTPAEEKFRREINRLTKLRCKIIKTALSKDQSTYPRKRLMELQHELNDIVFQLRMIRDGNL